MKLFSSVIKWIGMAALVVLALFILLLAFLSFTEYSPEDVENVDFTPGNTALSADGELTVFSWNIGYSGLGKNEEFVMDGGKVSWPAKEDVGSYLEGIKSVLAENTADIYLLQEVDKNSARSYGVDEREAISDVLGPGYAFAPNYSCLFVPLPVPVPGRVESGLATFTGLAVEEAQRIQLPIPFKWPLRTANLKRCLLVERIELSGSDKELVVVNLHLEAYDDGEGKLAQTKMMMELLTKEYAEGNYVIAGGDWNQTFPDIDHSVVPVLDDSFWMPGVLDAATLPDGWQYVCDKSVPSCRLLNMPYSGDPKTTQYYIIDGFLLSPNVELVSVDTLEEHDFQFSDHEPVVMKVKLAG